MSQSNSSVFTTPTAKPEGMNDKYPIFSNICQNLLNHWQPKLSAFIREVNGDYVPSTNILEKLEFCPSLVKLNLFKHALLWQLPYQKTSTKNYP